MRRFTLIVLAALLSVVTFAQKRNPMPAPQELQRTQVQLTPVQKTTQRSAANARRVMKKEQGVDELVTLPEGATSETYYTASGKFLTNTDSGWQDITASMQSIQVAVVGSDIYVQGLAYWFKEGWIKGTIDGTTATFANGQLIGTDDYGDEFIVGSEDGSAVSESIVFTLDAEAGTFAAVTPLIIESGAADAVEPYCYWQSPTFTTEAPAAPEVVVAPDGLETEEYAISARNYDDDADVSGSVKIGFAGNDVYVQGLCSYLPEAWAKGTLDGTTITFATGQYFGNYGGSYDMFLNVLMSADVVFSYDAEAGTLTAQNAVFLVDNSQYYFDSYRGCVLKKAVEKAAMPANPSISGLQDSDYGYVVTFSVPNVDTEGNALVSSKLSYIIYADIEGEIAPLTFTPATHSKLEADMTEIPFGFTENYDFYNGQIYLNDLYSADWNNLGIQSIYRGGDEENATEIQWFHIKDYGGEEPTVEGNDVTFDFNALPADTPVSNNGNEGDITENTDIVEGSVTLTVSPSTSSTPNRYWSTTNGIQLRVYGGTLTFAVPEEEEPITKITFNNGRWNADNSADSGEFTDNVWTGEARTVVVTIAGNTQLNSIEVVLGEEEENVEPTEEDVLVALPEGAEAEVWTIEGEFNTNDGTENVQEQTQLAKVGNDIYVQGLAYYFPEAWMKGTLDEQTGIVTFANGQFVGEDEYGKEYILGTEDGETICDIQFAYDAEAQTLTQLTGYILENGDSKTEMSYYGYWTNINFYAGEPIVIDPVVAPEDLATETYLFKAMSLEYAESDEETETESEPEWVDYSLQVQVGFDADTVYIQGLSADYAQGWVKATKNEAGQYVIPANQFMGTYDVAGLGWFIYDYFFTAVGENDELVDAVLNFDAETSTFSTDQTLALNGSKRSLYYYLMFQNVTITKMPEVAATPADPEVVSVSLEGNYPKVSFSIPAKDVDGNDLLNSKLAYVIWIEKDGQEQQLTLAADIYENLENDMTEIPYSFTDDYDIMSTGSTVYLNQGAEELATWTKIGVQSIYRGGGEEHKSNIGWYDIIPTGINGMAMDAQSSRTYDLQGRLVNGNAKGLLIKQVRQADGTVKAVKVIRK